VAARRRTPPRERTFDDLVASVEKPVRATALHLRKLVRAALGTKAEEAIYGGDQVALALYSVGGPGHVVCGIQPSGARCLFYLHRIGEADAKGLALRGRGKHARHLEFATTREVPDALLRRLVRLSAERLQA